VEAIFTVLAIHHVRHLQLAIISSILERKKGSPAFNILLFSGSRPAYAQPGAAGPAVRRRVHAIICSEEDADTSGHLQLLRVRWNQHLTAVLVPALGGTALPACFFPP